METPNNRRDHCATMREFFQVIVRHFDCLQQRGIMCGGLSAGQNQIIYELGKKGELSLNELAALFSMDSSTLSRQVNTLVELGMLHRVPNPNDRRSIILSLTSTGIEKRSEVTREMCKHISNILSCIPDKKIDSVFESIELIVDAIARNS